MRKNIPIHKSLKFKINVLVSLSFLAIIAFLLVKSNRDQKEIINSYENHLNQIAVDTVDRRFKVSYQILETGLAQIVSSPLIIEALISEDEEKLSLLVDKSYKKLQEIGVDEFHFYKPDGSSFLNLYEYKNKNVEILCERDIVISMNSNPENLPARGIEECQHGLFLRYIEPIYNDEIYIGSVELGMVIGSRILNIFKNVSGGEWCLYSLNLQDQTLMETTLDCDTYPISLNPEIKEKLSTGQIHVMHKSPYIIQMIPVSNYKGDYNYYLKRVFDNSELINLQKKYTRGNILYGILASIISIVFLWLIISYLLKPLVYLEHKVRKFESGSMDDAIEVKTNDEIGYLAGAMEKMRQSLYKRESELKKQSYIDPLTGAYNRLFYDRKIDEIVQNKIYPTTIIMADIDGLKQINDTKGHVTGDSYIIKCANIMKSAMRASDTLFRIGGDEFVLLFPNTNLKTGDLILERVNKKINEYNLSLREDEVPLSISFGLAVCSGDIDCLEQTMALADKKMYEDKEKKKKTR